MKATGDAAHDRARARLCVVTPYPPAPSETFITSHLTDLPASVLLVQGWRPSVDNRAVLSLPERLIYKAWRTVSRGGLDREWTAAYRSAFRRHRADAVLAEYGPTGVKVMAACRQLNLPLIVHFHGFDASVRMVLDEYGNQYGEMFEQAARIIAVSQAMRRKLVALGAPPEKVEYTPYGVDVREFDGASPSSAPPLFLAVGRFVEKKAPHVTLEAFAGVHRIVPDARLRMVGDGPMLDQCRALARRLGVEQAVAFLGQQPPSIVCRELRHARCFVQHSVEATTGDCEGTPVAIIEAGATGLPVVSTHHGGIPDVVIDGETGFVVEEWDTAAMARRMLELAESPDLAAEMGRRARARMLQHFSKDDSLARLWSTIERAIADRGCRPRSFVRV
jgi:glycosyltransferase involved in cell wall biosynthesis